MVFHDRSEYSIWIDYCECVNIVCALRWGVASIEIFSTRRDSPYIGKYFKCKKYTSGRRSCDAQIVKKAGLWLVKSFVNLMSKLVLPCILVMQESCN